jgi:hypothetical protein
MLGMRAFVALSSDLWLLGDSRVDLEPKIGVRHDVAHCSRSQQAACLVVIFVARHGRFQGRFDVLLPRLGRKRKDGAD